VKNQLRRPANFAVVRQRTSKISVVCLRTVFLIGLCYLFLFPLFYLGLTAIADPKSFDDPSVVWIPNALNFSSFKTAFEKFDFGGSIWLTIQSSVLGTVAALVSCSLVGYGFARFQFFEKKLAFGLVILTIIVPPQTLLISQYLQFRNFDFGGVLRLFEPVTGTGSISLISSVWVFVLPAMFATGLRNGLFIFIFRQFFAGLPKDLEEAARIDGCGTLKTFVRVIVPITIPSFVTVTLFSFVWHWNDFYTSDMLFDTDVKPLIPMLKMFQGAMSKLAASEPYSANEIRSWTAAVTLLTIAVPLILYIITQRFFVESVERTGIVG